MCKWTKEDFAHKPTRDTIPFREFRECGESPTVIDLALRGNPKLKEHLREESPTVEQSPQLPITVTSAQPTTSVSFGLIMFGAGIGLLVWLVRSTLKPSKQS